ncbi:deoxyribonuclease IV [Kyrpidia sp.]|uniref:deoxyribonuclease IV n=1 Tax=Kyrpidia sp. TaxID=2073077 RepID=UPI00258F3B11|nr:deoxyribonuclease IV [Kyrpidia sp.]MCL6577193.1 deoxyribonuclease IV [Kyrpidia sp.]
MKIGANVSIAKTGLLAAVEESIGYRATSLMIYTRSNRGGRAKPIEQFHRDEAWALMKEHGIGDPVVHAPYLINLASPKDDTWEYGIGLLREDIDRTAYLQIPWIVFHPGSHTGAGIEYGIERIATGLNRILDEAAEGPMVLLETMAGDGSKVGSRFEEIAEIIHRVERSDRLGVCGDTCHWYSAGYDIVEDFDKVLYTFDDVIGIERLKVFHINDSKNPFDSRKDRHANIGHGSIGAEVLRRICHHEVLRDMPLILETPEGHYGEEIAYLRGETDALPQID